MPRQSKGARLAFRTDKQPDGSERQQFVIRDGTGYYRLGIGPGERGEAEKALQKYLAEKHAPNRSERNSAQILISDVLELYANTHAIHLSAPELVNLHEQNLLSFWGTKFISDISGQACRDYCSFRTSQFVRGKAISPATVRRELKTLSAAVGVWHKESPLTAKPVVVMPPQAPARERFLTRDEAARLLWLARKMKYPHVARFILIGLYTGTRHRAILSLCWQEWQGGGWIDVDRGVIYRRGWGERETSKKRPPARIPGRLLAHMRRWQKMDQANSVEHVITWRGQPIEKMRRAFPAVVKSAAVSDVTAHTLRHTCATWALNKGATIWDTAALLGTSPSMIERTYGHQSADFQSANDRVFYGRA